MSWNRWRLGLFVGLLMGLFDGGIVAFIDPKIGWKPLVFLIAYFICKDGLNYLTKHPIDEIKDATEVFTKKD